MPGELILLVEDNDNNRMLVRDVLHASGSRVMEAETAEDGLRMAAEQRPALILMDIQLPGMSGMEALKRLRAYPATRAIPVIAVTASAMTQDRRQIMAAGFDGYQPKPISVKGFLQAVREMLPSRSRAGFKSSLADRSSPILSIRLPAPRSAAASSALEDT